MKPLLIALAVFACVPAGVAMSGSLGEPIWATPKEFGEINRGMRARAEKSAQEDADFRRKWEAEEPAREARRKAKELADAMESKPHLNMPASAVPSDRIVNLCLDHYRKHLKDPRSAYVVDATYSSDGRKVIVDGRAKNSFGGYIPGTFTCTMRSADEIDEQQTEVDVLLFQLKGN